MARPDLSPGVWPNTEQNLDDHRHWSYGISRSGDRQRVLRLEALLREIRAGKYGCSTHQLREAITDTLGDRPKDAAC